MHCFIALSLTVASPYLRAFFGEGHGLIIAMSELRCTGNELRITDCTFNPNHECEHIDDAGVRCFNGE